MGGCLNRPVEPVEPRLDGAAGHAEPPTVERPKPVQGFRVASIERRPTFTLVRYVAERPTRVAIESLAGLALTDDQPGILLQRP